jgi:hypothetical protein
VTVVLDLVNAQFDELERSATAPLRQMLNQGRTRWKRDLTTLFSGNVKPQERDCTG